MLKARKTGVGWVSAKNSNHFGIAGHYTAMAEKQGAFINTQSSTFRPSPAGGSQVKNKLASLEATLVRNSAHLLTYSLTHRGKV